MPLPVDDRVYCQVLGLPQVYKLKIARTSPFRHLFSHVPAQSFAPPMAIGEPHFFWRDQRLDSGKTPDDYLMEAGEGSAHTIYVQFPMGSPTQRDASPEPRVEEPSAQSLAQAAASSGIPVQATISHAALNGSITGEQNAFGLTASASGAATSPLVPNEEPLPTPIPQSRGPIAEPTPAAAAARDDDDFLVTTTTLPPRQQEPTATPKTVRITEPADVRATINGSPLGDLVGQYVRRQPEGNPSARISAEEAANREVARLREELRASEEDRSALQEKVDNANSRITELRRQGDRAISTEREEKEQLNMSQEDLKMRNSTLAVTAAEARKDADHFRAQTEALQHELREANSRADDFKQAAEAGRVRIRDLEVRVLEAEQDTVRRAESAHSSELQALQRQLSNVESAIGQRNIELDQYRQLLKEKEAEAQSLHVQVNDRDGRLRELQSKSDSEAKSLDSYMERLETAQREADSLRTERDELKTSQMKYLDEATAASKSALEARERILDLEATVRELRTANARLDASFADVRRHTEEEAQKSAAIPAEVDSLRDKNRDLRAALEKAEAASQRHLNSKEALQTECDELHAKLRRVGANTASLEKDLDGRVAALKAEVEAANADADAIAKDLEAEKQTSDDLRRSLDKRDDLGSQLRTMAKELDSERATNERLKVELDSQKEQQRRLGQRYSVERDDVEVSMRARVESLQEEVSEVRAQLRRKQDTVAELESALVECNDRLVALRRENSNLQDQLQASSSGTSSSRRPAVERSNTSTSHRHRDPEVEVNVRPTTIRPSSYYDAPQPRNVSPVRSGSRSASDRSQQYGSGVVRDTRVTVTTTPVRMSSMPAGGPPGLDYSSSGYQSPAYPPQQGQLSPRAGRARVPGRTGNLQ